MQNLPDDGLLANPRHTCHKQLLCLAQLIVKMHQALQALTHENGGDDDGFNQWHTLYCQLCTEFPQGSTHAIVEQARQLLMISAPEVSPDYSYGSPVVPGAPAGSADSSVGCAERVRAHLVLEQQLSYVLYLSRMLLMFMVSTSQASPHHLLHY